MIVTLYFQRNSRHVSITIIGEYVNNSPIIEIIRKYYLEEGWKEE